MDFSKFKQFMFSSTRLSCNSRVLTLSKYCGSVGAPSWISRARRLNPGCRRTGRHYKQTFGYDYPDILPRLPRVFETPLRRTGGGLLLDYPFTSVSAILGLRAPNYCAKFDF